MHWQDTTVNGTPWWDEIVHGFETAHLGVTIKTSYLPFSQYITTLETMTAGNELPDVFFGLYTSTFTLGQVGIAVDFCKIMPSEYFKRFYPAALRTWTTPDGAICALPLTAQMFAIYVNPKIMDSLGLSHA
jgi:ABC-type glycerol-3-phosphate transport system substrate-binding protein